MVAVGTDVAGMETLELIGDLGINAINEEEIAKCRAIFNSYDEDSDGKLTYAELLTCVRVCGGNPSIKEFKEMVQVVDVSLEGALDFTQFLSLYVMELKDGPNNEAEFMEAFRAFDREGQGFILVDDLKHVLTRMGTDKLTDEEADIMLKIMDKDGDGVLGYEEIIAAVTDDDKNSGTADRRGFLAKIIDTLDK